jgi:hypothetical protein
MRKLFGFVVVAAVLVASFATSAWAAGASFGYKPVKWASYTNPTGTQAIITLSDTTFITDESGADTTEVIDTSKWDWGVWPSSATAFGFGRLMITCTTTNEVTDSLYWAVQFQTPEGNWSAISYTMPAGTTASAYNSLVGAGGAGVASKMWSGAIQADSDALMGAGATQNLFMAPPFRIIVYGDVAGTTPKVSGAKMYINVPIREAAN